LLLVFHHNARPEGGFRSPRLVLGAVLVVIGLFLEREEKEAIQRQRKDQAMKPSGRGSPPAWWTAGPGDHFLIFNESR
jgi:hypothetical protein